jgi:alpha-mannosidase
MKQSSNDTKFHDTKFNDTKLDDTKFNNTKFEDEKFNDTKFNDTKFNDTEFNDTKFDDTKFQDTMLHDMKYHDTEYHNTKYYMIGNTHIDPVWLWKRAEGMQEVKSSFSSALDRMNEFPDFKFTMSSISYLEWIKENCYELFLDIKKRVQEGRWEIAGAMWVEPDCIMPSGESLIRHFLYSKRFLEENFQIEPVVGYNVDSFGHGSNLPSILVGCGMKYYLFNRPVKEKLKIPPVFIWKTPNNNAVISERIGGEYLAWTKPGIEYNLNESREMLREYDYDKMAVFYGVGNHGGGPTIDNIRSIYELIEECEEKLSFSTLKEFFDTIDGNSIPEFQGELGRIFMGCYSSDNEIKRLNRTAEWSLLKAEVLGAMASRFSRGTYRYPKEDMEKAWKMLLFNQFHDILSGTSIESARNDACQEFGAAITTARLTIANAVQGIANSIDTRGDGFPLILMNPTGCDYHGVFYADVYVSSAKRKQVRIRDTKGEEIPYSELHYPEYGRDGRKGILFKAEVPAMGYAVYRVLQEGPNFVPVENKMTVEGITISNGIITCKMDEKTGCPSSIVKDGIELLSDAAKFQVFYDDRGAWGEEFLKEQPEGSFIASSVKVIESNFLRMVVRSILEYKKSELVVDYVFEKDSDRIMMNCHLHYHQCHTQACFCVPVAGNNHRVITETAFLAEQKVVNDGTEYYQHRFADVVNDNEHGIAVLNNNSYSMSQKKNEYRLNIARSVLFARGGGGPVDLTPDKRFMDQGHWDFTLELLPHTIEMSKQRLFQEADFLQMPIEYLGDNNHKGSHWLRKASAFTIKGNGVKVSSYKLAEKVEQGEIIRIFECEGTETEVTLIMGELELKTTMDPYQIKSFRIHDSLITECNMIEK